VKIPLPVTGTVTKDDVLTIFLSTEPLKEHRCVEPE
jgi:hypothetical protein